jgi:hypothetical protein
MRSVVCVHSMEVIQNLQLQSSGVEERRLFAVKIAQDLFRSVVTSRCTSVAEDMTRSAWGSILLWECAWA